MPRPSSRRGDRTHPLIWLAAIILAFLALAVIISGIAVFAVYMIYKPQMPYLEVTYAHLDKLDYDQSGLLDTELSLTMVAKNDNKKADARFYNARFTIYFDGTEIAELRANPFDVPMNSSYTLNYVVPSSLVPLDEGGKRAMYAALMRDRVAFELDGHARTRWRVGIFLSVKFWTPLSCTLEFAYSNMSSLGLDCSSKSS